MFQDLNKMFCILVFLVFYVLLTRDKVKKPKESCNSWRKNRDWLLEYWLLGVRGDYLHLHHVTIRISHHHGLPLHLHQAHILIPLQYSFTCFWAALLVSPLSCTCIPMLLRLLLETFLSPSLILSYWEVGTVYLPDRWRARGLGTQLYRIL